MRRFFHIAFTIVVVFIGGSALFVLGSLMPVEGNYSFHIVESGSMEPAIKTGAIVAIIPLNAYEVGDVVLFEGTSINPQPTTHRIVEREGTSFVTKGDANEDIDYRRISEDEIMGRIFLDVPYVGYAAAYFGTPAGKAVLTVIAIVVIAFAFAPWSSFVRREESNSTTV